MTEGSRQSVTQHDRFANPQSVRSVAHIAPFSALRTSILDNRYRRLSVGARALFTWICLNSKTLGCAWRRLDVLAKELGLHRRILCLKRKELEDVGLVRTEYVARGKALPTGRIAHHQTAIFWPVSQIQNGSPVLEQGNTDTSPGRDCMVTKIQNGSPVNACTQTIIDPAMMIIDRHDHGSPRCTLLCDQILEEEGGVRPAPPDEPPPSFEEPYASIATDVLQRWKDRLAPTFRLHEDPEMYLEGHGMVVARLRDGVTKARCFASIEGHFHSPHNQTWERRTMRHVFGDLERLERMASLGMSLDGLSPPSAPKSEPRAKIVDRPVEPPPPGGLRGLIHRRKFEVQEIWKTATAKARKGIGLGVTRGYPAQDLECAAEQVPLEIETWSDFERWFTSSIVEWHATGQHNPKFDATTSAFYKWLANGKRHPYMRPQDIKQTGSIDEPWHKEF